MTLAPSLSQASVLRGRRRQIAFISTHLSLLGVLGSVVLVVVLHLLRRDLNPMRHFVSDYAVGPFHTLMTLAFGACGLGLLALVVGLYYGVSPAARSWTGLVLLTISGLCINIASWFHDEPQTSPAVLLDTVHDSIVQISLFSLALAALAWSIRFRKDSRWRVVALPAVALAVLMVLALIGFMLTPITYMGLAERILLGLYLLWVCGVLARLASLVSGPSGQRAAPESASRERSATSWLSTEGQAPSSP